MLDTMPDQPVCLTSCQLARLPELDRGYLHNALGGLAQWTMDDEDPDA